jgi:NAD(P)-dependent dehydrogenase (short-subunit alcohol dehydrogenase family)
MGAEVSLVNDRPTSEDICASMAQTAVDTCGAFDILVVASGINRVAKLNDMTLETFLEVMGAIVIQSWQLSRLQPST